MRNTKGFTIIESLVILLVLGLLAAIGFDRYSNIQSIHRDQARKTAIIAIYYNLEEVVRPALSGYPRTLTPKQLKALDGKLLKDPDGNLVGMYNSDYRYEPTGCGGGDVCAGYSLRADLEKEADFIRTNPRS